MRVHAYVRSCVYTFRQADRQTGCMHAQKERKKTNICNFLTLTSQCCTIDFPRCLCSCLSFCLPNCGCACRQTDRQTYGQTDRRTDRPKPICPFNVFEVRGIKQSTKKQPKKQKYLKTKQTARTHARTYTRTYIHTYIRSQKVGDIWTLKIVALTKTMTHI